MGEEGANLVAHLPQNKPCTLLECHFDPFPPTDLLFCYLLPAIAATVPCSLPSLLHTMQRLPVPLPVHMLQFVCPWSNILPFSPTFKEAASFKGLVLLMAFWFAPPMNV